MFVPPLKAGPYRHLYRHGNPCKIEALHAFAMYCGTCRSV
jgi:hypothetical protein